LSKNRKKILYIHHGWGIGGAPINLLFMIQLLDKKKYYPKIVFLKDSPAVELFTNAGIDCRVIGKFNRYFSHSVGGFTRWYRADILLLQFISWVYTTFFVAKQIISEENPDIIHLNSSVLSDWAFAAKRRKLPVICHIQEAIGNGYFGIRKHFLRKILNHSVNHFIIISKDNAKRLNLPLKTTVIYNFVDFNYFNKNSKLFFQKEKSKKYVLYLGGSLYIKGFDVLVDSLNYLDVNIIVLFAGYYPTDTNEYSLKRTIKRLYKKHDNCIKNLDKMRNAPNAKEIGVVTNIPSIISSSDIVVFPATVPHFARPVIEAGAMGKPVVVSDLEGMEEIVKNYKTGFLVKPNDPKELANAINNLCANAELANIFGNNGYIQAKKLFNSRRNSRKIEKVYESILHS